jgi:hypothetical protein
MFRISSLQAKTPKPTSLEPMVVIYSVPMMVCLGYQINDNFPVVICLGMSQLLGTKNQSK